MRIGHGYDVHRLVECRDLVLGGVTIPFEKGLLGHSDADVLLHAVMDALLGAAGLGDIGKLFPDTDSAYKGISSMILLEKVAVALKEKGYTVGNVDVTMIAQKPKLRSYIPQMEENIARVLQVSADKINVKATTEEHLGFTGDGSGMSCHAVCILE
ncbi:MAG: 2-C-methyl-D-erythritol 2,4-cyclodiphosphate synthase [Oscillospiraceae bacterium]|nr:2-C-methyl-D-erythritol 2,4-cyclodiphosphate synthase [Oscillospiraceae bacterium]